MVWSSDDLMANSMNRQFFKIKKTVLKINHSFRIIFLFSISATYLFILTTLFSGRLNEILSLSPVDLATFISGLLSPIIFLLLAFQIYIQHSDSHNNEKHKLEMEKEKYIRAQPIIELNSSTITHIEDDEHGSFTAFNLEITNHGAKAFKIHLFLLTNKNLNTTNQNKFISVDSFGKCSISISTKKIVEDSYKLELKYLDSLLQPQSIEFELVRPLDEIPDCIEEQFRSEASMRHDIKEIKRSFSI